MLIVKLHRRTDRSLMLVNFDNITHVEAMEAAAGGSVLTHVGTGSNDSPPRFRVVETVQEIADAINATIINGVLGGDKYLVSGKLTAKEV